MSSGVQIDPACKLEYTNIKMGHAYRFMVMRLSDDLKSIVVERKAPVESTYDQFVEEMKAVKDQKQCRFAVFDVDYTTKGVQKSKLVFIYWSPDTSTIKQKMVYSASMQRLLQELGPGMAINVEAHDEDELMLETVKERLLLNDRQ